ncbi:LysE family transporter [Lysinibacillus sp. FSL H8-0500]|uniref:LysE family translocator n=1 Tax=Lysinibacillus sp. FSL H8-0500 TaxID=2921393 RepID=UPI003100DB0C
MDNLVAYILMALVMTMLPGTDTILIIKNTLNHGARAGRYTILGMATGLLFWTIITVLGLSIIIAQSALLFNIIKYLGAAYLCYLGIRALFTQATLSLEEFKTAQASDQNAYLQGAISNILNPKTILVYITFMPQFIDLNANIKQQLIVLGFILTLIAVSWFLLVVYFMDIAKKWMKKPLFQNIFQKFAGILLISLAVKTAT